MGGLVATRSPQCWRFLEEKASLFCFLLTGDANISQRSIILRIEWGASTVEVMPNRDDIRSSVVSSHVLVCPLELMRSL
jgi:hypothetical protein